MLILHSTKLTRAYSYRGLSWKTETLEGNAQLKSMLSTFVWLPFVHRVDAKAPVFREGTLLLVQYFLCRAGVQSLGNVEGQLLLLFFLTISTGEVAGQINPRVDIWQHKNFLRRKCRKLDRQKRVDSNSNFLKSQFSQCTLSLFQICNI